ncbi:hypothetical protein niasHS_003665 [Heterodera schachtii]|uniref:Uncharacterized protein n=1 Tax=Heterodera schachtii TaxID=97005 RepID=A0ABD2KH59_HETSC
MPTIAFANANDGFSHLLKSHGISTESVDDETDTFPISRQWLRNSANKTNRKDNEQRVRKILSGGERKKKERQKKGGKKRHRAEHFPRIPSQSLSGSFEKGMVERRRHPDELAPLSQPLGREGSKWDTDNWNSD